MASCDTHFRPLAILAISCLLGVFISPARAQVTITKAAGEARHVKAQTYEAEVAADGALTTLQVAGHNLLKPGAGISRGAYCYQHGVVPLGKIQQPDAKTVIAADQKATVTYTFGDATIDIAIRNSTARPLQYVFVLDPALNEVAGGSGELLKTPARQPWADSRWFGDDRELQVKGADKIWGPWLQNTNVIETDIDPGQERKLAVRIAPAKSAKADRDTVVAGGASAQADLVLDSPKDRQVFQRRNASSGVVRLSGRCKAKADSVEARWSGKSADGAPLPEEWKPIRIEPTTHAFNARLRVPAGGWYTLRVRARNGEKTLGEASVERVGVGEVFVIAGQSNSTNYGAKRMKPHSGLASTFDGTSWREADDPQPGTHDNSTGGSPWPAFADEMVARFHVPIGIASTGHGGTSVNAWQPGGELFRHTLSRIDQLGYRGFRAVLWHQGETDTPMASDEYFNKLANVIRGSTRSAGWEFPWFVAQVSYHNPKESSVNTTRDAQRRLWEQGIALQGPDTDTLTGDNRDQNGAGIHLSEKGLMNHGKLWADKVAPWLQKVLAEPATNPGAGGNREESAPKSQKNR